MTILISWRASRMPMHCRGPAPNTISFTRVGTDWSSSSNLRQVTGRSLGSLYSRSAGGGWGLGVGVIDFTAISTIQTHKTLTHSLPQPVNFPGSKAHPYTLPNSILDGPVINLLSILRILIETLSHAHAKGATTTTTKKKKKKKKT